MKNHSELSIARERFRKSHAQRFQMMDIQLSRQGDASRGWRTRHPRHVRATFIGVQAASKRRADEFYKRWFGCEDGNGPFPVRNAQHHWQ